MSKRSFSKIQTETGETSETCTSTTKQKKQKCDAKTTNLYAHLGNEVLLIIASFLERCHVASWSVINKSNNLVLSCSLDNPRSVSTYLTRLDVLNYQVRDTKLDDFEDIAKSIKCFHRLLVCSNTIFRKVILSGLFLVDRRDILTLLKRCKANTTTHLAFRKLQLRDEMRDEDYITHIDNELMMINTEADSELKTDGKGEEKKGKEISTKVKKRKKKTTAELMATLIYKCENLSKLELNRMDSRVFYAIFLALERDYRRSSKRIQHASVVPVAPAVPAIPVTSVDSSTAPCDFVESKQKPKQKSKSKSNSKSKPVSLKRNKKKNYTQNNLESLVIHKCDLEIEGMDSLLDFAKRTPKLKSLKFSGIRRTQASIMGGKYMRKLLDVWACIKTLHFEHCVNPSMSLIFPKVGHNYDLTEVSFSNCIVGSEFSKFAELLSTYAPNITNLNLSSTSGLHLKQLFAILQSCKKLKNVNANHFYKWTVSGEIRTMMFEQSQFVSLERLSLCGWVGLDLVTLNMIIRNSPNLKYLNICNCKQIKTADIFQIIAHESITTLVVNGHLNLHLPCYIMHGATPRQSRSFLSGTNITDHLQQEQQHHHQRHEYKHDRERENEQQDDEKILNSLLSFNPNTSPVWKCQNIGQDGECKCRFIYPESKCKRQGPIVYIDSCDTPASITCTNTFNKSIMGYKIDLRSRHYNKSDNTNKIRIGDGVGIGLNESKSNLYGHGNIVGFDAFYEEGDGDQTESEMITSINSDDSSTDTNSDNDSEDEGNPFYT